MVRKAISSILRILVLIIGWLFYEIRTFNFGKVFVNDKLPPNVANYDLSLWEQNRLIVAPLSNNSVTKVALSNMLSDFSPFTSSICMI